MTRFLTIILTLGISVSVWAETFKVSGAVSFRQRSETDKEYTDFTQTGEVGSLRNTTENNRSMLGYQLGIKREFSEELMVGVTFRSGLGSVMWQNIDNNNGLMPGIQEAYINWSPPHANLWMGKFPQQGNAFWDLYASTSGRVSDARAYNPVDGIFNDRFGALSGFKAEVPFDLLDELKSSIRFVYQNDKAGGSKVSWEEQTAREDERELDWYMYALGFQVKYVLMDIAHLKFDFDTDIGMISEKLQPRRSANLYVAGSDSIYADEGIWGFNFKSKFPEYNNTVVSFGMAKNERDSVFTSEFQDISISTDVYVGTATVRLQNTDFKHEFGVYRGHGFTISATHFYVDFKVHGLELQPRIIMIETKIDDKLRRELERVELTATVRF